MLALYSLPTLAQPAINAANGKDVVARVGASTIARADIKYKIQLEQAYGSPAIADETALVSVMQDAIEREVARSVGADTGAAEIAEFSRFADESSKAPEILQHIKGVFGENKAAYARLYLSPKIVNRKLRHYYSRSAQIHRVERARIEQALQLVNSGKSFEEAAKATGLTTLRQAFENKTIEPPDELKRYQSESMALPSDPLFAVLDKLALGAINPDIIEDDRGYRVIRLIAHDGAKYTIETIGVVKPPFEAWFKEQSQKLRIEIKDTALKRAVKMNYPSIDWVERME